MSLPLLTAVTPQYEAQLTSRLGSNTAVHVVRRCADLAELLGAVAAGIGRVAVLSAELRGLDRAAVHDLRDRDVLVLGVHRPGDEAAERMLRRWGVRVVLPADADQPDLDAGVAALIQGSAARGGGTDTATDDGAGGEATRDSATRGEAGAEGAKPGARQESTSGAVGHRGTPHGAAETRAGGRGGPGLSGDGARSGAASADAGSHAQGTGDDAREVGRVVVVWGPVGAPGRTTVAVNVAAEAAQPGDPVILVDLDTYGAAVAQVLAVLDEAPGVAAATRAADRGTLDRAALTRLAPEVCPGLRVLTGMPRPDRWTELKEHAVQDVLARCAGTFPLTVVDVGFCLETDEELSFDTTAPRRNGAALAALEVADEVVVVGSADPVALQRLVRGLDQLSEVTSLPVTVVVNRVRAGAVGKEPGRRIREALRRFASIEDVVLVGEDQAGLDAALLAGRTLREARPASPARAGLREVATRVSGRELAPPRGRARAPRAVRV